MRLTPAKRPVLGLDLDTVDENVVRPQPRLLRKPFGDPRNQAALLRKGARIAHGQLNDGQVISVPDTEVARGMHELSASVSGDDLKQILL